MAALAALCLPPRTTLLLRPRCNDPTNSCRGPNSRIAGSDLGKEDSGRGFGVVDSGAGARRDGGLRCGLHAGLASGARLRPRVIRASAQSVDSTFRTSQSLGAASSSLVGSSLWGIDERARPIGGRGGGALGTTCLYGMATQTIRWGLAAAATVLLLKRNPGTPKQFLIPILALEAPSEVVSWIRSEYGLWVAFVGMALRLFYHIPAELDFPLGVYLFITTAPAQALAFRGTMGGSVACAVLAAICAYQYFTSLGIENAFRRESLVNTVAILVLAFACIGFFAIRAL